MFITIKGWFFKNNITRGFIMFQIILDDKVKERSFSVQYKLIVYVQRCLFSFFIARYNKKKLCFDFFLVLSSSLLYLFINTIVFIF